MIIHILKIHVFAYQFITLIILYYHLKQHPNTIIFLTADAFGVLPPIAKLTKSQAMYHFLSGFTSKLAGTERGVTEPEPSFSTCFGAPFLPLNPNKYADLLGELIDKHDVDVYLVNTGWTGGKYGVGRRISLHYTRYMVDQAIKGKLKNAEFTKDEKFGLSIPTEMEDVPKTILNQLMLGVILINIALKPMT